MVSEKEADSLKLPALKRGATSITSGLHSLCGLIIHSVRCKESATNVQVRHWGVATTSA